MTLSAKPRDLERFAVVVMMLLGRRVLAHGTGFRKKFSPALIHVGISTGIGPLTLFVRKVHVPWAVVPGVRSMARAAVALGQSVIRTEALGAGCFHGTNCSTNTKKLQGESVYKGRGPFSDWESKSVSRSTYRVKQGQGPRRQRPGPFFGARGGWGSHQAPGRADPGPGTRARGHRATDRAPGSAHQVDQASGSRPPGPGLIA